MRNLKRLLSVLMAFAMAASVIIVPTYAASEEAIEAGFICEELELLIGDGDGVTEAYLDKSSTRMQLAILNARWVAFEEEAYSFTDWEDDENFFDFDDGTNANEENMLAYYWLNSDLGFIGTGDNLFEPQGAIMNTHFAKVLLVSMGYPYGDEYNMSSVLDFAYDVGIDLGSREFPINNGDIAIALYAALESPTAMDITFAQYLIDLEVIDEEKCIELDINYKGLSADEEEEPYPDTFEVLSYTADNFAEVELTLNAPIDEDSIKKDNIRVDGSKIGSKDEAYVVEDKGDGAILRIFLPDGFVGAQNETRTISVSGLKNPVGTTMSAFSQTILFRDTTAPTVDRVEPKGTTRLDIYFTEPVRGSALTSLSTYQINDKSISASRPELDDYSRVVTIKKIYTTLTPGTYTLGVRGGTSSIEDWAGNSAGYVRADFTIVENTEGPTVQAVLDPVYPTKVDIEFDHEIQDDAYISWMDGSRENKSSSTDIDGNVATFEFDDTSGHKVIPLRLTTITLKGAKDYWNNAAEGTLSFDVTPIADTVRPTVVDAGVDDQNTIWVEFDKKIYDDGKYGTWAIRNGDGDRVTNGDLKFELEDDKKVMITKLDGTDFDSGDYTINVRDTKDRAKPTANQLLSTDLTVTVPDLGSPEVLWARWYVSSDSAYQGINVYYSKEVDFSTATTRANYKVDKGNGRFVNLPNTATVELMAGDRLVRITFAKATADNIVANADDWVNNRVRLQVADVQDKVGNAVSLSIYNVTGAENITNTPTALATDIKEIKISVGGTTPLTTYDISDYNIVTDAGASTNIDITDIGLDDDDTSVVLTINNDLNSDATYGTGNQKLAVQINGSSELYGLAANNRIDIGDGIAPSWIYTYYHDDPDEEYEYVATGSTIVLVFDEKVEADWLQVFSTLRIDGTYINNKESEEGKIWEWDIKDAEGPRGSSSVAKYWTVEITFKADVPTKSGIDVEIPYYANPRFRIADTHGNAMEDADLTQKCEEISIPWR